MITWMPLRNPNFGIGTMRAPEPTIRIGTNQESHLPKKVPVLACWRTDTPMTKVIITAANKAAIVDKEVITFVTNVVDDWLLAV